MSVSALLCAFLGSGSSCLRVLSESPLNPAQYHNTAYALPGLPNASSLWLRLPPRGLPESTMLRIEQGGWSRRFRRSSFRPLGYSWLHSLLDEGNFDFSSRFRWSKFRFSVIETKVCSICIFWRNQVKFKALLESNVFVDYFYLGGGDM